MKTMLRIGVVALLATVLGLSLMPASAQMAHYQLNVTLNLTSTQFLTGGTVCVDAETTNICQDIEAGSGPTPGYTFDGLESGEHTITVNADPYLEAIDYANLVNPVTDIYIDLYLPALPNTGSGPQLPAFGNIF